MKYHKIGDFGVLVYSGFKKKKALILNFVCTLTAILGGLVGYYLYGLVESISFLLPIAAGGFIYISASDLIPETRKEMRIKRSLGIFLVFALGIVIMVCLRLID